MLPVYFSYLLLHVNNCTKLLLMFHYNISLLGLQYRISNMCGVSPKTLTNSQSLGGDRFGSRN